MFKKVRPELWLIAPLLLLIGVFFLLPYVNMIVTSFMSTSTVAPFEPPVTLQNYIGVLTDPFNWAVIGRTVLLATVTTVITLVIGFPVAYHMARASGRAKSIYLILVISPLLVGVIVRTYGWIVILADRGVINNTLQSWGVGEPLHLMYNAFGVTVGMIHIYLPFLILPLASRLASITPDLELAAHGLGAGPVRTFLRVVWPMSLPGVFAGTVVVWILAASAYVIPALLGGNQVITTPMLVVQSILDQGNWPLGTAQAAVLFVVMAVVVGAYAAFMSRVTRKLG
ncbi:MAG: ABC transporter permease [Terrimesophilobacter sp.]